jgi:precorrin-6B methylase 1
VAASYARVATDKAVIITFHITGSIEYEKEMLLNALKVGKDVILLPRPWDFMPYHISKFLESNGIDVNSYVTEIYENLTLSNEKVTKCMLSEVKDVQYSDLCVMVIKRKR